jgi:hypothetical protein
VCLCSILLCGVGYGICGGVLWVLVVCGTVGLGSVMWCEVVSY